VQALDARPRPCPDRRVRGNPLRQYLVRHAKAGRRSAWTGPDDLRPLSKAGRQQAAAIAAHLSSTTISGIVSSPFLRCRQTVEPLAAERHLPVDLAEALTEGADVVELLRLIDKVAERPTVLCTHGDVIARLLEHLDAIGVPLDGGRQLTKGSIWVLDLEGGEIVGARYQPPPG
jgi:8-oxo-(d)GTP phosphatase